MDPCPETTMELRTLGDCQIVIGDERLGPQSPFAFALALYLAMERGRRHTRDELLALFLPGVPEPNAAHNLRQTLYKLRQLGVPAETTASGTTIAAAAVRDDYTALLTTHELPDARADQLPGEFLPGYWPKLSEEFSRWLESRRDAVNGALRRAYVTRILDRRAVARWDEVERYARACLVVDPLNEEATLALAESLALSGSKAAGVRVLDRYIEEVGGDGRSLTIPASVLRRRISERLYHRPSSGEIPLLGREEEMRDLKELLEVANLGERSVVWIHGEPGIGKTRLIGEFCSAAALSGARVVTATYQPHDVHRPLGAIVDILPAIQALPGSLGCSSGSLTLLDHISRKATPVGGIATTHDIEHGNVPIRLAVSDAVCDLIEAVSSEVLFVLSLDDVQWADPVSLQVVDTLLSSGRSGRTLVIIGSRFAAPSSRHSAPTMRVSGLRGITRTDARQFVSATIAQSGAILADEVIERITAVGAGNPFYLRSLTHHFLSHPDAHALPARFRDVIEHRIRSAAPGAEITLLSCALLGSFASVTRLGAVLELTRYELASQLDGLEYSGLITSRGENIAVAHSIVADVVADMVSDSASVLLRRTCASCLEQLGRSTGSVPALWAAHDHWTHLNDASRSDQCSTEAHALDSLGRLLKTVDCADNAIAWPNDGIRLLSLTRPRSPDSETYELPPHGDASNIPDQLMAIARDGSKSGALRLRAAISALSLAEHSCDPDLARRAYEAALAGGSHATGDARSDLFRAHVAYHSVFGSQAVALTFADSFRSYVPHPDARMLHRAYINAAEAFMRCGRVNRALPLYDECFTRGEEDGLVDHCAEAAAHGVWAARQVSDIARLSVWRSRSHATANRPESAAYPTYLYNEILLALDQDNDLHASELLTVLVGRLPSGLNLYHHALLSALRIQIAVRLRRDVRATEIDTLRSWLLRAASLIPQDDGALACIGGIAYCFDNPSAERFRSDYLRVRRRTTYPLLPGLAPPNENFGV